MDFSAQIRVCGQNEGIISGRAAVESPPTPTYGARLRPLGYHATENYTLLTQQTTHQINVLYYPPIEALICSLKITLHVSALDRRPFFKGSFNLIVPTKDRETVV